MAEPTFSEFPAIFVTLRTMNHNHMKKVAIMDVLVPMHEGEILSHDDYEDLKWMSWMFSRMDIRDTV